MTGDDPPQPFVPWFPMAVALMAVLSDGRLGHSRAVTRLGLARRRAVAPARRCGLRESLGVLPDRISPGRQVMAVLRGPVRRASSQRGKGLSRPRPVRLRVRAIEAGRLGSGKGVGLDPCPELFADPYDSSFVFCAAGTSSESKHGSLSRASNASSSATDTRGATACADAAPCPLLSALGFISAASRERASASAWS